MELGQPQPLSPLLPFEHKHHDPAERERHDERQREPCPLETDSVGEGDTIDALAI